MIFKNMEFKKGKTPISGKIDIDEYQITTAYFTSHSEWVLDIFTERDYIKRYICVYLKYDNIYDLKYKKTKKKIKFTAYI